MRQLHVLGLSEDGTTLLLGATARSAKASHRIRLDDRLKAAVRGQLSAPGSDRTESALPPKEIQARLRAGATPDEVAKAAGIPVARVLPYFAPVEAERERIIGDARRAIVHRHRGPDATAPLGEAVDTRLREVAGIKDESVEWTARRRPDGAWVVAVAYSARGGRRSAEWLWQPAGRSLTALDSSATRLAADATPARKRPARKAATPKAGSARPSAKRAAPKRAQPKKVKSKNVASKRRPATKKAVVAPAARPRPATAPKPAPVKRAVAARKTAATSAKATAPKPRVAAVKTAAPAKAARPAAAKKVAAVKSAPARKPTVKKPATSRKPAVKKTRERATPAPRFTLVPPPADTAPVQEPEIAPASTVVPVAEPAATPAAAAPAAAAATEATPEAPRRKPGTRVPLPSWSEVLLGVGGSSEGSDASRRGN